MEHEGLCSFDPTAPNRRRDDPGVPGKDRGRRPPLAAGLGGVPAREGSRGRAQRARRPVRRHRAGGVVAVRRADQHAHHGPAGSGRPHVLPVAHHGALLADPVGVPDRAQPPPQRVRLDLRDLDRASRATARTSRPRTPPWRTCCAKPDGARSGSARTTTSRSTSGRPARPRSGGRWDRATTGSTASSAARPTTGTPRWPRTTGTSRSRTPPRRGTTCPRTWPTRRCG